jgi:hypothetical protein
VSKIPRSSVGTPAGLRYKHSLKLMPYGLNIASSKAGTEYSGQGRNNNVLSLLQLGIFCPFLDFYMGQKN